MGPWQTITTRTALVLTTVALVSAGGGSAPIDTRDFLALSAHQVADSALHGWTVRPVRGCAAPHLEVRDTLDTRFLRVAGTGTAAWFGRELHQPIAPGTGTLRWSWRVIRHPEGADLRRRATDDAALRVFVVFEKSGWFERIPRTLFYSTGTIEAPAYARPSFQSANMHIIRMTANPSAQSSAYTFGTKSETRLPIGAGTKDPATWMESHTDPFADYQRVWGGSPRRIVGVGFMQDSEETNTLAVADLRMLQWHPSGGTHE